jgi:hypothetical protein
MPYDFYGLKLKTLEHISLSGINFRQNEGSEKLFPCVTVRTLDPYKKRGFYYTTKAYIEQTFGPKDIFKNESFTKFLNLSVFQYKEIHTLFYGNINVICPLKKVNLKKRIKFNLRKGPVYEFYFFPRGEELWFGLIRFPNHVSVITIETATMQSADLTISERETQQLSKKGSPCQNYESTSSSEIGFVECGREAIVSYLRSSITCLIPGLSMFFLSPNELPECQDKVSAN